MTRPLTAVLVLASVLAGCVTTTQEELAANSPGPALVVERFLQAANANDLDTMMELFGTRDRTIDQLDGRRQAEQRMHVLATLLHHDDYSIRRQYAVPGRSREAATVDVQLVRGDRSVVVPHIVVRKRSGGWIIENIEVEQLTRSD